MGGSLILRSFFYLDDNIVDDYLAQLEGMLLDSSYTEKTTISQGKEGGLGVNVPSFVQGNAKANNTSVSETERRILETPVVKFTRLHQMLTEQNMIQALNGFDEEIYKQIQSGEVIEIQGEAKLPAWEGLTESLSEISDLAEIMKALGQDPWADPQANQAFQGFTSLAAKKKQEDTVVIVLPFGSPRFKFVARLDATRLKRRKEDLKAEITILGKVHRKLAEKEIIEIFRLIPEMNELQNLNRAQRRQAGKKGANNISTQSPLDEIIKYPAMQLQPIAIYQ